MAGSLLKFAVLAYLKDGGCRIYSLKNKFVAKSGKRPSSGALYPIFESLISDKLVSQKKSGNSKIYSLTKKGLKQFNDLVLEYNSIIDLEDSFFKKFFSLENNRYKSFKVDLDSEFDVSNKVNKDKCLILDHFLRSKIKKIYFSENF